MLWMTIIVVTILALLCIGIVALVKKVAAFLREIDGK